jgi:uncharacterized protein
MSLKEQIDADIKRAMLAKEKDELKALRSIKSLILLAETEKGAVGEVSKDAEIQLLTKAAKQRKESAELFMTAGRNELADAELAELRVIERYLPKQLGPEELLKAIRRIVNEVGASGPQDMGKVMARATKELAGQAEGKTISSLVKELLTN